MADRLPIVLYFDMRNPEEIKLYNNLKKYTNPAAHIKDVLRGLVPVLPLDYINDNRYMSLLSEKNNKKEEEDDENQTPPLMDF